MDTTSRVCENDSGYFWYILHLDNFILQRLLQYVTFDLISIDPDGHENTLDIALFVPSPFNTDSSAIWSRHRREKKEERVHVARLDSSRGPGEELIPPGLESVFNPMAQIGPGSVFDRSEGRMAKADSLVGFSPLMHSSRQSILSSGAHHGIGTVSPLSPDSSGGCASRYSPPELDTNPIRGGMINSTKHNKQANIGPQIVRGEEAEAVPRATLGATENERETGTYVNS
ncbi:hypothetical protein MYCTH_2123119 [Thermothelomyces thermophilus ATCC 42464]|uniref:Uncharacterized protein n=1 Tax=Thermothelomyces thermophilus (strain ATCC 42464 / BCRC 31852 / DSM 1799) TaxID=573729 RepID=G2Q2B4_THET4|nr:uncharacterized protein MYCTH_2123119 [Thermothelomyces thermophilus ATCC 42464]AEO54239.1 hypothetical protein MYCTH_2123119 [Thermothelomyces thermophilus ATCC 42464]